MTFQQLIARFALARTRLFAVVAAVLVAEAIWLTAALLLGIRLAAPAGNGYPEPVDIGPLNVGLASGLLSLLGWALLAALERRTRYARRIWLLVALLGLAASLSMPLSGTGVSVAGRAVLVVMHLAVAAVIIPLLYRRAPARLARGSHSHSPVAEGGVA